MSAEELTTSPAEEEPKQAARVWRWLSTGQSWAAICAAEEEEEMAKRTARFQVFQDKAGEYRWRLLAANHRSIACSGEGYGEKRKCLDGIDAVKRAAKGGRSVPVEDLTAGD